MTVHDDVKRAREAARALEQAVTTLTSHYADNVDARRLRTDVERVVIDLDLLCGQEPPPVAPVLQVIDDTVYPQDFWMDAEDEGLGGTR